MFNGSNRGKGEARAAASAGASSASGRGGARGMFSVLGPDMAITGNVVATADLHIDGRIEGDVQCGVLAQGPDSRIIGNVVAETARIAGTIEGSVRARQLTVERTARIDGDVEYETITIENGGHVDGRLKHMSPADAAKGLHAVTEADQAA